jgi:hypothetical protein
MGREATATGPWRRSVGWVLIVLAFGIVSTAARIASHQVDPNVQLAYAVSGLLTFAAMLLGGTLLLRSAHRAQTAVDADEGWWHR